MTLGTIAAGNPEALVSDCDQGIVTARGALDMAAAHTLVLVDLRPQVMRQQGTIASAVIVEPDEVAAAAAANRLPVPLGPVDEPVAVFSCSARRSLAAARELARLGYRSVAVVDGGFEALAAACRVS